MFPRKPRQYLSDHAFKVLQQFKERGQHSLPDFMKLWNENHMSMVYEDWTSPRELCEFINECFMMTIALLRRRNVKFEEQAGLFYLLYCLYGSQPLIKYKIRMTIEDYDLLCNLFDQARKDEVVSLVYGILKLKHINAIHIVGNITLMGPDIPMSRVLEMEEEVSALIADWIHLSLYSESQPFQELIDRNTEYEKMKCELVGYSNPDNQKEDFTECIRAVGSITDGATKISEILDNDKNVSGEQGEFQGIGARRVFLKDQQMDIDARFVTTRFKPQMLRDNDDSSDLPLAEEEEKELDELGLSIVPSLNDSSYSKSSNEITKHISVDDNQSMEDGKHAKVRGHYPAPDMDTENPNPVSARDPSDDAVKF